MRGSVARLGLNSFEAIAQTTDLLFQRALDRDQIREDNKALRLKAAPWAPWMRCWPRCSSGRLPALCERTAAHAQPSLHKTGQKISLMKMPPRGQICRFTPPELQN